jgi:hypothetical protein
MISPRAETITNTSAGQTPLAQALSGFSSASPTSQIGQVNNALASRLTSSQPTYTAPQPFSYNPNTDQQYQSALAGALQNAKTAQNNAMVSLGSRGIGNSSIAVDRANQIQQRAVSDVQTNLLPTMIEKAYQRYNDDANRQRQAMLDNYGVGQDQIGNLSALSQLLSGQQNQSFNQGLARENQTFNQGVTEAGLTGTYLNPEARNILGDILALKQQAEGGNVSSDQMAGFRSQAEALRNALYSRFGINADQVGAGYENDYADAARNVASYQGVPTLQARTDQRNFDYQVGRDQVGDQRYDQEFEYKQARDQIADEQYKQKFDEDVRRFGLNYAMEQAQFNNQVKQQGVSNQIARERLDLDRQQTKAQLESQAQNQKNQQIDRMFSQGLDSFKATGKMPDFMKEFGIDVQGMNTPRYAADLSAMYDMLSTGKAQPKDLLKQIDDKVKIGAEQSEDGERMKQAIYTLYPNLNPSNEKEPSGNSAFNTNWLKNLAGYGMLGFSKLIDQANLDRISKENPSLNGQ